MPVQTRKTPAFGRADNEATDSQPHSSSEIRFHGWWFHGSFQFPQLQTPLLLHTLCLSKQAYRRIAHRAKCLIHLQVHILCLLMPSKVCAWRAPATHTLVSKPALTLMSCPRVGITPMCVHKSDQPRHRNQRQGLLAAAARSKTHSANERQAAGATTFRARCPHGKLLCCGERARPFTAVSITDHRGVGGRRWRGFGYPHDAGCHAD